MPAFQINDEEREALRGLPMLAREVYVFGLRPFMDYATGIVGIKRGVSWKSIAEELYVEPHQGIKGGEPSEKELRRALAWLQRVGLLSENRAERRLVFELLQASRDQSARNKVGSKWADEAGSYVAGQEASNGAAFQQKGGSHVAGGEVPKVGTPPVSGIPPTTLSAREAPDPQPDTRQRFAMHDDWQPSARGWKATLMRNGLGITSLGPDALMEFRSYWINRPEKHQTQGQWEHDLAQSMKRGYRHEQANGRTTQAGAHQERAKSSRAGQRPLSAVERVEQAIERNRAERAKACGTSADGTAGEAVDHHGGDLRPPLDGEFWREPEA